VQHELGLAADDDLRLLVEQTEGEVSPADKVAAMKAAVEKRAVQLRMKMGKLVAISNPEFTDGWLHEVRLRNLCPYQSFQLIFDKRTSEVIKSLSHKLNDITPYTHSHHNSTWRSCSSLQHPRRLRHSK
jgi:hypothetical protein